MARTPSEIIAELRRLEPTVRYRSHVFTSRDADAMCKAAGVMKDAADLIEKLTTVKPCTCPNPPHDKIVAHNDGCPERALT